MKLIVSISFFVVAWGAAAQPLQTNLPTVDQAVKVASQLSVYMREKEVTAFVERHGLRCDLIRAGGSIDWSNVCYLTNRCCLLLHFRGNGLFRKSEYGLLDDACIGSNGVRIVTIKLTNSVGISNAP